MNDKNSLAQSQPPVSYTHLFFKQPKKIGRVLISDDFGYFFHRKIRVLQVVAGGLKSDFAQQFGKPFACLPLDHPGEVGL